MAIKNNSLGGIDWNTPTARIKPTDLNDTFDSVAKIMEGNMVMSAQQSYEQVKSDSGWTNTDYLGADIFTDSNGAKNTISSYTTRYDSPGDYHELNWTDDASGDNTHDPNNFTNSSNAFDNDDGTYANSGGDPSSMAKALGKTFSSKWVHKIEIKADFSITAGGDDHEDYDMDIKLQSYNGTSWGDESILNSKSGDINAENSTSISYDDIIVFDKSVQGLRVQFNCSGDGELESSSIKLYSLEYGDYDSSSIVETNTIINEKVPKSLVVYGKKDLPTNTDITIDISQDGGSTWDLTGKEFDTYIDTSSFTGSDLALKFNLSTTDTSITPKIYGYGVSIIGQ